MLHPFIATMQVVLCILIIIPQVKLKVQKVVVLELKEIPVSPNLLQKRRLMFPDRKRKRSLPGVLGKISFSVKFAARKTVSSAAIACKY